MFGRTVKIDDKEWLVLCTPDTPLWDVLLRAAKMAKEDDEAAQRVRSRPYHDAIEGLSTLGHKRS